MTEQNQLPPNGEDPVLDQQLLALKRFAPIIGFENRVLSRVWRPAPMFVLIWQDRLARFFTPRRRWMLAGAASLGSLVSTLVLVHLVRDHLLPSELGLKMSRAMAAGVTENISWDGVWAAVASITPTLAGVTSTVPALSSLHWTSVALGVAAVELISLVGLYLVARRPVRERVRSYASR